MNIIIKHTKSSNQKEGKERKESNKERKRKARATHSDVQKDIVTAQVNLGVHNEEVHEE